MKSASTHNPIRSASAKLMIPVMGLVVSFVCAQANADTDLKMKNPGRAPGAGLKMKSSKVPQFELVTKKKVGGKVELGRVSVIPKLDIGEEPTFEASQLSQISFPPLPPGKIEAVKEILGPKEVMTQVYTMKPVAPAAEPKAIIPVDPKASTKPPPPPTPKLPDNPTLQPEPKAALQKTEEMSPTRLKLLQALIFLERQKSYNLALGLFAELLDEQEYKIEATYQLALTSLGLGLYSEYKYQMTKVLKEGSPEWQKRAAISLAKNAQAGDKELVALVDPKLVSSGAELSGSDQYQINRAKFYLDTNSLTPALAAVEEVPPTSSLYMSALALKSIILYRSGQLQEAIELQSMVSEELSKNQPNTDLRSASALTLARMYFQAGRYKDAFQAYLKIDKRHPDWLQAMVEQAWAQILYADYEGAAGNMFSLHSEYFKNQFAPESYVVRTVAYLNLCQYGDGARVVAQFKKRYALILKLMQDFKNGIKNDIDYYDVIKEWAGNPAAKFVRGLPKEFVYTLTLHPAFINEQKLINSAEDQITTLNTIALDLIKKERSILNAQNSARAALGEIKKKLAAAKNETEKQSLEAESTRQDKILMNAKIEYHIAKKARTAIKELRANTLRRLESEKTRHREKAALAVKSRFMQMLGTLTGTIDQSDILLYELYSGAGEHIRFQMAGGEISEKSRPELKVPDNKALKWDFQGEIWQDELGHYRSSLKNVCPPEDMNNAADETKPNPAPPTGGSADEKTK